MPSEQIKVGKHNVPKKIDLTYVNARPPLSARRKTAPNTLFRTLSSYAKSGGNSEGNGGDDLQYNTHRSLPSSPNGTREKMAATAEGGTYFFQRRISTNPGSCRTPPTPTMKRLRDRLPFVGTKQR
jgi:hypothetical protein